MKLTDNQFKSLSPDVQIALIHAGVTKFEMITGVVKSIGKYFCIAACFWIILKGIADIGQINSGSLKALGKLIEALKMHVIVGYLAAAMFGAAWKYERSGKKRAIKQLGRFRKEAESCDPYRSSSELRENGDTPEE